MIRIDTPESVDLAMEPAGFGSRFLAAFIDGLIQGAALLSVGLISIPVLIYTGPSRVPGTKAGVNVLLAVLYVFLGLLFSLYKPLMEAIWHGQTVGKRVAGIRVVQNNGMPAGILAIIIRNLMRVIDAFPYFIPPYLIGGISVLSTNRTQRLGDLVAGTVVVRDKKASVPMVPERLYHKPSCNLNVLRQYVLALPDADLVAARGYWERMGSFDESSRYRVARAIAEALAARMGWPEPLPENPEWFIVEVLYVRAS